MNRWLRKDGSTRTVLPSINWKSFSFYLFKHLKISPMWLILNKLFGCHCTHLKAAIDCKANGSQNLEKSHVEFAILASPYANIL